MMPKSPHIVKKELLEKLDSVEMLVAQRFLASGHWVLEEEKT